MSVSVRRSDDFKADIAKYFAWYCDEANEHTAWRFQKSVDVALERIAKLPDLGTRCHFRDPTLRDLHSFRVDPPFNRILIFYRISGETLEAWRLMHGSRNLSERLLEPPY